jgi:hypothetical protein
MASKFQSKVIKEYKDKGYLVIKVIRFSDNGWPDLQCIKDGLSTWIECKEKDDTLKDLQKYRINQLIKHGCIAFCLKDGEGKIFP